MKRKISVILTAVFCLSALTPFVSAANSPVVGGESNTVIEDGQDLVLKNVTVVPETGFIIVTEEMDKVIDSKSLKAIEDGQDLVLKNVTVVPETGFIIVTEEMDKQDAGVMRGDPDRNTSKTFKHVIYDTNHVVMATCYATVTGTYSQADGWAKTDSVTAYFVGDFASHFSYTLSKSGAYGYLNVKYNGASLSTFTYNIATNGVISKI